MPSVQKIDTIFNGLRIINIHLKCLLFDNYIRHYCPPLKSFDIKL